MGAFEYDASRAFAALSSHSSQAPSDLPSPAVLIGARFAGADLPVDRSVASTPRSLGLCRFAVIERRDFLRECIVRSLSSCSTLAIDSFASVEDLLKCSKTVEASLLILSVVRLSEHEAKRELDCSAMC